MFKTSRGESHQPRTSKPFVLDFLPESFNSPSLALSRPLWRARGFYWPRASSRWAMCCASCACDMPALRPPKTTRQRDSVMDRSRPRQQSQNKAFATLPQLPTTRLLYTEIGDATPGGGGRGALAAAPAGRRSPAPPRRQLSTHKRPTRERVCARVSVGNASS